MKDEHYIDILDYSSQKGEGISTQDLLGPDPIHISFEKKIRSGFFHHNGQINWGKFELQAEIDDIFEYTANLTNSSVIRFIVENKKSLAEYYGYNEDEIQILNTHPEIRPPKKIRLANIVNPKCKMVVGHIGLYDIENHNFNNLERVWGNIFVVDLKNVSFANLEYLMGELTISRCENVFFNKLRTIPYSCTVFLSNTIRFDSLEYIGEKMTYARGNYNICFNKLEEIGGNLSVGRWSGVYSLALEIEKERNMSYLYKDTDGFPALKVVHGNVDIFNALCDISNLEKVLGKLKICTTLWNYYNLPKQYKLNFSSLKVVSSTFTYSGNGNNIIGFSSLRFVLGSLKLESGKNIDLNNLLRVSGKITIESNACELPKLEDNYGNKRGYQIINGKLLLEKDK